jgi:hypothetical protein
MGEIFLKFMAEAIYTAWREVPPNSGDLDRVEHYTTEYLQTVYAQPTRMNLVRDFATQTKLSPIQSGEFDGLSYAFFRDAFELMAAHPEASPYPLEQTRRRFTQRVGRRFFGQMSDHLSLQFPHQLTQPADFDLLTQAIEKVGHFLKEGGYLRDHFAFRFDVETIYQGQTIKQTTDSFLEAFARNGVAYALYEMGYPAILPSAVYLFHTIGEAQHHSSRTIEELFARTGCEARETDDFDPTGYPSDLVVELWEIRNKQ